MIYSFTVQNPENNIKHPLSIMVRKWYFSRENRYLFPSNNLICHKETLWVSCLEFPYSAILLSLCSAFPWMWTHLCLHLESVNHSSAWMVLGQFPRCSAYGSWFIHMLRYVLRLTFKTTWNIISCHFLSLAIKTFLRN